MQGFTYHGPYKPGTSCAWCLSALKTYKFPSVFTHAHVRLKVKLALIFVLWNQSEQHWLWSVRSIYTIWRYQNNGSLTMEGLCLSLKRIGAFSAFMVSVSAFSTWTYHLSVHHWTLNILDFEHTIRIKSNCNSTIIQLQKPHWHQLNVSIVNRNEA